MHSSTTDHDEHFWRVRLNTPFDVALNPASPERTAGHGNDRVWKAWKAMKPASHPLWKSLRDSHIPTASTGIDVFWCPRNSNHRHRKGLVTDVSGPQRNACHGTLRSQHNCACPVNQDLAQVTVAALADTVERCLATCRVLSPSRRRTLAPCGTLRQTTLMVMRRRWPP
jgi:hypothetical protein